MLKTYLDSHSGDYLSYLEPLVLHILGKYNPIPVTDEAIQGHMENEFGLFIPRPGIQIVLKRIAKKGILKREYGVYNIEKAVPDQHIDERREEAFNRINAVTKSFIEYSMQQFNVTMQYDEAQKSIITFLSEFSIECLRAYIRKTAIPDVSESSGREKFMVSKFIKHSQSRNRNIYESFIVIVKCQMLANALICPDIEGIDKSFARVNFYMDTPLILHLLNLEGDISHRAIIELIRIITSLGGKFRIFEHTFQEVYAVIGGIAHNLDNLNARGKIINEMRKQNKQFTDLMLLREDLDDYLRKYGITKEDTPAYTPRHFTFQIDEAILEAAIDEELSYYNPAAKHYDIESIRSIYILRLGKAPVRIEDANAVLLTENSALARSAFEYGKKYESTREVSSVVTDFSIANIAWLKAPLRAPSLPEAEVMAICYAALEPGDSLWGAFLDAADKLQATGEITSRQHQILRCSSLSREELMNLTMGQIKELSQETVMEIAQRVEREIGAEKDKEIEQKILELKMKQNELIAERVIQDQLRNEKLSTDATYESLAQRIHEFTAAIGKIVGIIAASFLSLFFIPAALLTSNLIRIRIIQNQYLKFGIALIIYYFLTFGLLNLIFGISIRTIYKYIGDKVTEFLYIRILIHKKSRP